MKDFTGKVDGTSTLAANGANSFLQELENLVLASGQTLDSAGESIPDPDTQQLARAMTTAVAQAASYNESGTSTANARVLENVGNWVRPVGYVDAMLIIFRSTLENTGPMTIDVGGLGAVPLHDFDGTPLASGEIPAGVLVSARYNTASSRFDVLSRDANIAAGDSAAAAAASAAAAAVSETNAAASATTASTNATSATTSATNAANSATAAATSATSASTSATNASQSESNALTSANNAQSSATAASTSETNAANDASAASTSASNAATSATNAASSATNASNSASIASSNAFSASTSASNASESATSASNSAISATNSSLSAAASATNAANSFDSFDDRYLGAKASDPTTDNDGDPLTEGVIYWNSTTDAFRVYNGAAFQDAVPNASLLLSRANNLSDLTNAAQARTNLSVPGLSTINTFTQAQRGTIESIAETATITLNFNVSNHFVIAPLTANRTIATPTNRVAGQVGFIQVSQSSSTARTLTFSSDWVGPDGGTVATPFDGLNVKTTYSYAVLSDLTVQIFGVVRG